MPDNNSISPLGTYGLGGGGMYSSYDPAMMAMMTGYSSTGLGSYGMGMGPMMGGYGLNYMDQYLQYMQKMTEIQHKMEEERLKQATNMHALTQQADVYNLSAHDRAFFEKAMVDGAIQKGVRDIYDAIRLDGNLEYVVKSYYDLKQSILNKYSDYFNTPQGQINAQANIDKLIQDKYAQIGQGLNPSEPAPDLKNDIRKYGENSFQHGFNTAFLGEHGHNKLTAEQALNQMFGTGINDSGSKRRAEQVGSCTANYIVEPAIATAVGTGVTTAGASAAYGISKLVAKAFGSNLQCYGKVAKFAAAFGAIAGLVGDILWQNSRA